MRSLRMASSTGGQQNLGTQAEDNRELTRQLADQHQCRADATQTLIQESVNPYTDFVVACSPSTGEARSRRTVALGASLKCAPSERVDRGSRGHTPR